MANRARGSGGIYPPNNAPRQNEYFVPRDGIDREVITADICRYLGNDALVRPGTHPHDNGRVIQGYFITAYRNLTTAMIADLKNDSARWDAERRKHQSGAVRYQDSQIRDGPQRGIGGGGGGGASYGMQPTYGGNNREYDSGPRYPGSEAPGYSSGPGGPGPFGPPGGLGGYGGQQYSQGLPPQAQYAPQQTTAQDPRYGGPSPPMGGLAGNYGAGNNGAINTPLHQEGYSSGANYAVAPRSDMYSMDMAMTDAPMAPARRNSPPGVSAAFGNAGTNARGGYGGGPGGPAGGYGGYAPPAPPTISASYAQPIDNGYGRAPTSSNTGFSPAHDLPPQPQQAQQYEDPAHPPSPTRAGTVATNTQAQLPTNSGQQTGPRRDRDRAVSERSDHPRDRERIDRTADRDRERDATPPNRTGSATKSSTSAHHHYGSRR